MLPLTPGAALVTEHVVFSPDQNVGLLSQDSAKQQVQSDCLQLNENVFRYQSKHSEHERMAGENSVSMQISIFALIKGLSLP